MTIRHTKRPVNTQVPQCPHLAAHRLPRHVARVDPESLEIARDTMRLSITITTRARRTHVEEVSPGILRVSVTAPPHRGQANEALIAAVAAHFRVARSRVSIVRGHTSRIKLLEIEPP